MSLMILLIPLISSIVCGIFGSKMGYNGVKYFSFIMLLMGLTLSLKNLDYMMNLNCMILLKLFNWFNFGLLNNFISMKFDLIMSGMFILVYMVSLCVHLFSCSYMDGDPHLPSFISYLSLFTFFMLMLVSSSNLMQLFMGWEGVGLCSYLLINFWFTSIQANKSAMKAMIMNKIGDMGLMLGIMILWFMSGTFDFSELFMFFYNNYPIFNLNLFMLSLLLMIMGVMGKSSQMGLHMWLPDAMEGPTPVSALIHAATMVTAGVFIIISLSPLFELVPSILMVLVIIGTLTCFFSAIMGLSQNDFKKVMAYSTCSQLGYMVTICGFSYYSASFFHLINHGFFKALLFLSAGSVIHSFFDEQDFSKTGGVKEILPVSYILILTGSLSLMGLPFLTGFYSKDLIIELINDSNYLLFSLILSLLAASLTAFYSFSLMFLMFLNYPQVYKSKFNKIKEGNPMLMLPLILLFIFSIIFGYLYQFMFFKDNFPLMVNNLNKFYPFILSLIGGMLSLILGLKLKKYWNIKSNILMNNLYNLSMYLWYFDLLINNFLVKYFMMLGYNITYKFMDNQILEKWGPYFFYHNLSNISNLNSKFYSGKITSYMFLFSLFMLIIININKISFDYEEMKI